MKVYILTQGTYEVEWMKVYSTHEGAQREKDLCFKKQNQEAEAYTTKYNKPAPAWMSRDIWDIEEREVLE